MDFTNDELVFMIKALINYEPIDNNESKFVDDIVEKLDDKLVEQLKEQRS